MVIVVSSSKLKDVVCVGGGKSGSSSGAGSGRAGRGQFVGEVQRQSLCDPEECWCRRQTSVACSSFIVHTKSIARYSVSICAVSAGFGGG